jgi:hypothetical protein
MTTTETFRSDQISSIHKQHILATIVGRTAEQNIKTAMGMITTLSMTLSHMTTKRYKTSLQVQTNTNPVTRAHRQPPYQNHHTQQSLTIHPQL